LVSQFEATTRLTMQPKSKVRKHLELSTHPLTKTLHYDMRRFYLGDRIEHLWLPKKPK